MLAHEITHVRNNDIWVMSLADILSRFTRSMSFFAIFLFFLSVPVTVFRGTPVPWVAIMLLYFAPTFSSLLQLALSRSREFDADLGGASLTGDPEGLALALGKLERYQGRLWEDIFMPGRRIPIPSVLRTHPQTSERIARLMALKKPETAPLLFRNPWGHVGGSLPSPRSHDTIGMGSGFEQPRSSIAKVNRRRNAARPSGLFRCVRGCGSRGYKLRPLSKAPAHNNTLTREPR